MQSTGEDVRNIVIYRDLLLPISETFVRSQAEALTRFSPVFAGARCVSGGLPLPPSRTVLVNEGGLPGSCRQAVFRVFGVAPRFVDRLKGFNPLLVHAHFGVGGVMALPVAEGLGVPLLVTFHGYEVTMRDESVPLLHLSHQMYLRRRKDLQRKGHVFIAVSEYIRQRLLEQGYPAERTLVHYIGVDTAFFVPDDRMAREPVVLFAGRLIEVKGGEYLIRAMQAVQRTVPHARLVIAGDGPLRPRLERLAMELAVRGEFTGNLTQAALRHWMNRAAVFCVPSVTAASGAVEAFGLVFAEAQAMGVPVVSTRTGGIPEAVIHDETGLIVPEKDVEALANAIERLLTDSGMWNTFSVAGRRRVRSDFDLARQSIMLERLYEQTLGFASA